MPTTTMTSVERVNAWMERREQDRVPRHESFWSDTIQRWQSEGLDGNGQTVLDMLESDFGNCGWMWPAPFPGRRELIAEDDETRTVINQFGQTERVWKGRSGTPEHHGFACETRDDWFNDIRQRVLDVPYHLDPQQTKTNYENHRKNGLWTYMAGAESFEQTRRLMGDETTMIAMIEDPEWVVDVSRTHTDILLRDFQQALDTGIQPDGLWIYGDMAFNHATMCSPAMYKELIWPDHKRLADFAHDNGMKFIYHTDGCVNGVVDLWVEAGIDAFQPIEAKAHMDVRELCPKYADSLSFFGNIDVMVMSTNDREKIESEIAEKFEVGKAHRNYAYHSDHSVPPAVSWQTYQFIIECVNKHGWYA
jgi:uroporphyrinogen decarboxylase